MNTKEPIRTQRLELYYDWHYFKMLDLVLVSDDEINMHMFMIYHKNGDLLHGYHIERIYNEK